MKHLSAAFFLSLSLSLSLSLVSALAFPSRALAAGQDSQDFSSSLSHLFAAPAGLLGSLFNPDTSPAPAAPSPRRAVALHPPQLAAAAVSDSAFPARNAVQNWLDSAKERLLSPLWNAWEQATGLLLNAFDTRVTYVNDSRLQPASAAVAVVQTNPSNTRTVATSSPQETIVNDSTPLTVNNYITQPVIERIVQSGAVLGASTNTTGGYVTQAELAAQLNSLQNTFGKTIYGTTYPAPATNYGSGGVFNAIALSNKIDKLSGTNLSSITVNGVSGLADADIPDTITASNYLLLTGGTLSGNLVLTGNLTVSGAQTLSGAITIPYLTATSTSIDSSFVRLMATNSTTTNATSTNLYASILYAPTASTTNLTFANATGTSATTTNFFATNASSTNLFASYATTTSLVVSSTASTSNLTVSNSFTLANLSGFLKATAGAVATALVNLASDVTGILPVTNGGTGWANIQSGTVLYGNGTSALATTTAGTAGYVLAYLNGVPTWTATTTLSNISGTLAAGSGGTGISSPSAAGVLVGNYAGTGWQQIATSSLGLLTTNVAEGSSLYFTTNRVASVIAGTTTDALAQGSVNKYYSTLLFAADLAGTTTNALAEGSTNKYYTDARVGSYISGSSTVPHIGGSAFGDLLSWTGSAWASRATSTLALNTDNLIEGSSNLFWTNTRFDNRLSATTTLPNITTLANLATVGTITSGAWNGSTLGVAYGGTGWANIAAGAIPYGNGSSALATTSAGTAGYVLAYLNGVPTWAATTTLANISGTLAVGSGGTGLSSIADGALLFGGVGGGTANLTALATTSGAGRFLTLDYTTGRPSWVATSSLNVAFAHLTGNATVVQGGTGQTSFGQGWLNSDGTTISASTSPTVNYIIATSTTRGSSFAATTTAPYFAFAQLGSAGAPALTFSGNTNTGVFSPVANALAWTTGGMERARLDSSGNFLIGTTTPGRTLTVFNTAANAQQRISYDATRYSEFYVDASGDLQLTATGKNLRANDANLYLCDGGACPTTPVQGYPSSFTTNGNAIIAGTVYAGGFGPATCPTGMIPVPASPADGTQGFCVDKYEAQSSSGNEVSVQGGSPWVSITQTSARAECIRAGKHLITEREWQTIAHNAENVGWNWNGGVAGTNQMSDGHSDNVPANSLATAADTSPCSGTGQTCDLTTWDSQRRVYELSNSQYIWDFGGNVWEWVDQTVTNDYPIVNSAAAGWQACSTSGDGICGNTRTTNDQWYRGGFSTIAGFRRGGPWSDGARDGAFALALNAAPSASDPNIGFRCSR